MERKGWNPIFYPQLDGKRSVRARQSVRGWAPDTLPCTSSTVLEPPGWKSTSAVLVLNAKPLFFPHFLSLELLLIRVPALPQGGAVEAGEGPSTAQGDGTGGPCS